MSGTRPTSNSDTVALLRKRTVDLKRRMDTAKEHVRMTSKQAHPANQQITKMQAFRVRKQSCQAAGDDASLSGGHRLIPI